jgi:hypothetical protein
VGNEDGTITIWDAKKAAPICNCYSIYSRCDKGS